ncbi:MAG: hypothetical protein GX271_00770 [Clostridiales bacterium]|nr:hypothetical protein [Clostridiales bacterium]
MNNQFNYPNNEYKFIKKEKGSNEVSSQTQKEQRSNKSDEDLIIEENTIYEIDRECVERLKRNRRR